jgi:hypothetical protein
MVRDGRTLDHRTLEEIRRIAVERVRDGEDPSTVIASYGFCRTTIYKWLRTASGNPHQDVAGARLRIRPGPRGDHTFDDPGSGDSTQETVGAAGGVHLDVVRAARSRG